MKKTVFLWAYTLFMLFAPIALWVLLLIHFNGKLEGSHIVILTSVTLGGWIAAASTYIAIKENKKRIKVLTGDIVKLTEVQLQDNIDTLKKRVCQNPN